MAVVGALVTGAHERGFPPHMIAELTQREALPQDSWCPDEEHGHGSGHDHADGGHPGPFGSGLSYAVDGSPTVTITKTLFSTGTATSTQSLGDASNGGPDGTNKATTTGMSTVYNTVTVTSTSISTTTLSSLPASSITTSDLTSSTGSSASKSKSAVSSSTATSDAKPADTPSGAIAGSVIGSMAAFSMIGFLVWYLMKKKGGLRLKAKLNIRRRKSTDPKSHHREGQNMEETRAIMLQRQADNNKSKESDINAFPPTAITRRKEPPTPLTRDHSQLGSSEARQSRIGVAVSSSALPNTPPLPRSQSQKGAASVGQSQPAPHPPALTPGFRTQPDATSTCMPAALKPVRKPAPILTTPHLGRGSAVSPLSPRGMLNAVSNKTSQAWRRASQALSPGAYERMPDDGQGGFEAPKRKESGKIRNPEMEIGKQTDGGWNKQWI